MLACWRSVICVIPSVVEIKQRAKFYPHYYFGSLITLLLTIPSSTEMFEFWHFFFFARSLILHLKLNVLRTISIQFHSRECLAHPHVVGISVRRKHEDKITYRVGFEFLICISWKHFLAINMYKNVMTYWFLFSLAVLSSCRFNFDGRGRTTPGALVGSEIEEWHLEAIMWTN